MSIKNITLERKLRPLWNFIKNSSNTLTAGNKAIPMYHLLFVEFKSEPYLQHENSAYNIQF